MKNNKVIGLDFIIDKLSNSIENVLTGDSFATDISILKSIKRLLARKINGSLIGKKSLANQKEMFIN